MQKPIYHPMSKSILTYYFKLHSVGPLVLRFQWLIECNLLAKSHFMLRNDPSPTYENTVSPVSYINNLLKWNKYNIVFLGATAVYGHLPEFNEIFRNGRGSHCTNYKYKIDSWDMGFWRSRQNLVIYFLVVRFVSNWVLQLFSICA